MSGLFGSKSSPPPQAPPPPPPAPTTSDSTVVQNEQRDIQRRKRGRAATVLTSPKGDLSTPVTTATSALLGRTY
jgi:hypothetical protein